MGCAVATRGTASQGALLVEPDARPDDEIPDAPRFIIEIHFFDAPISPSLAETMRPLRLSMLLNMVRDSCCG
jgi:hypothetical protein